MFGDVSADTAEQVATNWDEIKKAEKQRNSATDGIALGQPALSLAAKLVQRSGKAGLDVELPSSSGVGEKLLAVVAEAVQAGIDPELALRATARSYADSVRAAERSRSQEDRDSAG